MFWVFFCKIYRLKFVENQNDMAKKFELVKTTPELAKSILESGNRKIVIADGDEVEYINLNNETCGTASKNGSRRPYNLEDVELFIKVPANAKTVY